jgi:DNA-binding NtrC family response regulator
MIFTLFFAFGAVLDVRLLRQAVMLKGNSLADIEGRLIRQALRAAQGNRSEAARRLRINRTTLIEKMRRLGIA